MPSPAPCQLGKAPSSGTESPQVNAPRLIGTTGGMRCGNGACQRCRSLGRSTRTTQCDRYGPPASLASVSGASSAYRRGRASTPLAGGSASGSTAITSRYTPPHRFKSRLWVRISGCAPPPAGATPSVSATYSGALVERAGADHEGVKLEVYEQSWR